MKLAMIADIHGNLPALKAMEQELARAGADEIWFLGDAVGKGPDNAEACDWVRANCSFCIGGNWDFGLGSKEFPDDKWYWDQLGEERLRWLAELPPEGELNMSGIRFRLFHGRPVTELLIVQFPAEQLEATFSTEKGDFGGVIFADSHRPFIRTLDKGYMINTGSVGNSLGVTNAHALLLEGEMNAKEPSPLRMTILAVPYDKEEALRRVPDDLPKKDCYIREITTGIYSRLKK